MGIADFLKNVLESAGRPMDLREMKSGILVETRGRHKRKKRPLRIAIDVSSWVYKAAHGFGDMLADERHLTNYGRAALLQEQIDQQQEQEDTTTNDAPAAKTKEEIQEYITACTQYVIKRLETLREQSKADLLVVLDGPTPPIKTKEVQRRRSQRREHVRQRDEPVDLQADDAANERRTKAFRRAGAGRHYSEIIAELIRILKKTSIAFMVAPYEADSQLAYLSINGYIDLIVTEDSDLVAHGAKAILYKSIGEIGGGKPRGILLRQCDLGSVMGSLSLVDFSPVMLAAMFVAVGCDYCDKLKGIGLVKACRAVRKAFLEPRPNSALAALFAQLYEQSYTSDFTDEFKRDYEESIMSALIMYRHPVVFDPMERECLEVGDPDHYGDPELIEYEPYAQLLKDKERRKLIVGGIPLASESTAVAESHQGNSAYLDKTTNEDDELDSSDDEGLGTQQDVILPGLGRRKGPQDADIFDEKKQEGVGTVNEEEESISHVVQLNGKRKTAESNMKAAGIPSPSPGKVVNKPEEPEHTIVTENAASAIALTTNGAKATTTPAGKKDHPSQNSNVSSTKKLSQASLNDDTSISMSIRSPNLLYSSTPEKTQASQGTQLSSPSLTQPQTQAREKTQVSQGTQLSSPSLTQPQTQAREKTHASQGTQLSSPSLTQPQTQA
jgi:exonuclease-1